jgi:hypothetical protein
LRSAKPPIGLLFESFSSNTISTACTKVFQHFEITSVCKKERR